MVTPWMVVGCPTKQAIEIDPRRVKSRSQPYLTLDLCSDILSRLPVKTLLRFRCASQSWRSLIDDPHFCYLHYHSFKNNAQETHLFIPQLRLRSLSPPLGSITLCTQTLETTKLVPTLAGTDTDEWLPDFANDGLVLLTNLSGEAMLWNPSIRRCRRIPLSSPLDFRGQIGIGLDPVSQDHKYVLTFFRKGDTRRSVAVYSVRANSWKTRPLRPDEHSYWSSPDPFQQPISFRGSLYKTRKQKKQTMLVAFSLSTEEFNHKSLPPAMSDHSVRLGLAVVDGGSTLAAVGRPWKGPGDCVIWALETDTDVNDVSVCWTKRYMVRISFIHLLLPPKEWGGNAVFLRKLLGKRCYEVVAYNLDTHQETIIQRNRCRQTSYAALYKETLVLLN